MKKKVFYWFILLFAIFTVINTLSYRELVDHYVKLETLQKMDYSNADNLNFFQRTIFYFPHACMMTLLLYLGIFLRLGLNFYHIKGKRLFITSYLLLIPITGFLFALFILFFIIRG